MTELLLAFSLLAPIHLPAEAINPVQIQIPIDSRVVLPDGRVLVIKGTVPAWIEEAPPPPPPGPQITALKNEQGQGVESIRSGEVLVIEGTSLWQEKEQLRVQLPGRAATVLSFSPERIRVRFPAVSEPVTGPLLLYWNHGDGWVEVARLPRFTVLPATVAPGRLSIKSYHGADGIPKRLFKLGEPITFRGEGFGWEPGRVLLYRLDWPVLSWSDTEIRIPGSLWPTHNGHALWLELETARGERLSSYSREFDPEVVP